MLLEGDVGNISKEEKKYISDVYGSSRRLTALVKSLLNTSRVDMGLLSVEPEPTNVEQLVGLVIKDLSPQIKKQKIDFEKKITKGLPLINLDPKLFEMVFQNLLSNSIKYNHPGGKVSLSITKNRKVLKIKVKDTGIGIPLNQQKKVFTKLFRADNVNKVDVSGTVLGLYLAKAIIDQSDGKIWFESKLDKGTTFYIEVPLKGMKSKSGTRKLEKM